MSSDIVEIIVALLGTIIGISIIIWGLLVLLRLAIPLFRFNTQDEISENLRVIIPSLDIIAPKSKYLPDPIFEDEEGEGLDEPFDPVNDPEDFLN